MSEWEASLDKRPSERTAADVDVILSRIKDIGAFDNFHPILLKQICCYGYYEDLEGGVIIFRQGDRGRNWYTVLSGSLHVVISESGCVGDYTRLYSLEEGSAFGDVILSETPHGVTVITAENTELLRVEQQDFLMLWKKNKRLMEGVLATQQRRSMSSQKGSSDDISKASSPVLPTKYTSNSNGSLNSLPKSRDLNDVTSDLSQLCIASPVVQSPSCKRRRAAEVTRSYLAGKTTLFREHKSSLRTFKNCALGCDLVRWVIQFDNIVNTRLQAVGIWQALLEEGLLSHVNFEHPFKDEHLLYRFTEEDSDGSCKDINLENGITSELQESLRFLAQAAPDALMRMIFRKKPKDRTVEELELVYEELLHIKALAHLSTMVKRELASVLMFESHATEGTTLFNQGDEGKSWYIILKGSVNVVIHGKGIVCSLHEGDDFGKLALVNDSPRAATIILREDNCHFLRVDKEDFNRILRDVEANTVRLKEHGQDVLVLEQLPTNSRSTTSQQRHSQFRYSVMAGTPGKMLEYLLETRMNKETDCEDTFVEDFILTHIIYMPTDVMCPLLMEHFRTQTTETMTSEKEKTSLVMLNRRRVVQFVERWVDIVGDNFYEDTICNNFIKDLYLDISTEDQFGEDDNLETVQHLMLNFKNDIPEPRHIGPPSPNVMSKSPWASPHGSKKNSFGTAAEPIKPYDEILFRVYCADHTYTTLKARIDAPVSHILKLAAHKLCLGRNLVLSEVKSSSERIVFSPDDVGVVSSLGANGRLFIAPRDQLETLVALPCQIQGSLLATKELDQCGARELAYHLTTYHWELFNCLNESEIVYQVFGRKQFQKITANLQAMVRHFTQVQHWVMTEICLTSSTQKRVALLRKFIKVAAQCREYQNLFGFFAIVMGLTNSSVNRLESTWEKLPHKFLKLQSEFEINLDPSRNHRIYRQTLNKLQPPVIPFIPLLLKDMTFTNDGNKTHFEGLVNFEKMRMLAKPLRAIRWCRSRTLTIESPVSQKSSLDVRNYVRNLNVIDNQKVLNKLSHQLEPRRSS